MADSPLAHQMFVGDSEMAGRMRSLDWSKTALGLLQDCPQSVRTAVGICPGNGVPCRHE